VLLGILSALCLLAAAARADAPAPAASPPVPRIVIEPLVFDFGSLRPERVVEKEFVLRNNGRADLVIESLVSSCGCTAALTDAKVVKAGHGTPLRVRLTVPDEAGRLTKSILVKSNDPAQPTVEVKVTATVVRRSRER